jgi:hypothetical protein
MSRGASIGRSTPRLDGWKKKLVGALTDRGARTRLAEWLEKQYGPSRTGGSTVERWKAQISRVLNTPQVPDGEFVLAVDTWILQQRKKADG